MNGQWWGLKALLTLTIESGILYNGNLHSSNVEDFLGLMNAQTYKILVVWSRAMSHANLYYLFLSLDKQPRTP